MAVSRVTSHTSTPTTTGAATTQTITGVVGSGGNLIIAIFGWRDAGGETMSAATYDGNAMTRVPSATFGPASSGVAVDAWYYLSPAGTGSVVGTWSAAPQRLHGHAHVFSLADVGGTPLGTAAGESVAGASATTDQTLTTVVGGMVVDVLYVRNDDDFTADAGQTEVSRTTVAGTDAFECSIEAAAGTSTVVGWTWSTAGNYVHMAIPIRPSAGGGGGTAVPVFVANLRRQGIL